MIDVSKYGPTPTDLGTRQHFENEAIPIARLLERIIAEGKPGAVQNLRFTGCFIHGPGVVIADPETRFLRCDLGDVKGDVRNLFLIAAGPRITGGVALRSCVFEECVFRGVGFVGNQHYVDNMIRELTAGQSQ